MSEREPAVLRDEPAGAGASAGHGRQRPTPPVLSRPSGKREAPSVYVVGFWQRFAAAAIDFVVILPVAMLVTFIVSRAADVHLPARSIKLLDVDLWIDLALAGSS